MTVRAAARGAKPTLEIGLIGSGFMGQAHSLGYALADRTFDLSARLNLNTLADVDEATATRAAARFGFARAVGDWRDLVADPAIDIVSITAPNALHKEMALAAIAAGKHVYCEKPLAATTSDAREMTDTARAAGVKTQLGFNYLCNPMLALAREMIASGELGEIRSYRGVHAEDYMADADAPFTFRHDPAGGGALADLGSHALATAEFLLGPIERVLGDCVTVIPERPSSSGRRAVEVDDIGRALLRFDCGASGSIEANWLATGRTMQHDFEVYGSKGALVFTQERLNELHVHGGGPERPGFRRLVAGPEHAPYGAFCVAPGHQLGFNELKAIEAAGFAQAILDDGPEPYGFAKGLRIQFLVDAINRSSATGGWTPTP